MPELPEVETVCRGLRPHMEGAAIASVQLNRPDLRFPFPDHFANIITGTRVESITRRAKYILMNLDNDHTLLTHLGMSGRMLIHPEDTNKHDHVVFYLEDRKVVYRDPRRFGFMDLVPTAHLDSNRFLQSLGIEPLSHELDGLYLQAAFKNKKSIIKTLLLNQSIIAGLGNIYVCEALFDTGIHPESPGHVLNKMQLEKLSMAIKNVLKRAISAGGSSLQDHRQVDGNLGYFQHQFKVYGRSGEPCMKCQVPIHRLVQSGRSTFFCPSCQAGSII